MSNILSEQATLQEELNTTPIELWSLRQEVEQTQSYKIKISDFCAKKGLQACYDSFSRSIVLTDKVGNAALIDSAKYVLRKDEGAPKPSSCSSAEILDNLVWQDPSIEIRPVFEQKGYKVAYSTKEGMCFTKGLQKMTLKPGMYRLQNGACMVSEAILDLLLASEEKQKTLAQYQNDKFRRFYGKEAQDAIIELGVKNQIDPYLLFSLREEENNRETLQDVVIDESRWASSTCRRLAAATSLYKQKTGFDAKIQNVYTQAFVYYFLGVETGHFSLPKAQKVWDQYLQYAQGKKYEAVA